MLKCLDENARNLCGRVAFVCVLNGGSRCSTFKSARFLCEQEIKLALAQNFQEKNPTPFELIGLNIEPYKAVNAKDHEEEDKEDKEEFIKTKSNKLQKNTAPTFRKKT